MMDAGDRFLELLQRRCALRRVIRSDRSDKTRGLERQRRLVKQILYELIVMCVSEKDINTSSRKMIVSESSSDNKIESLL
jgi:hypothetical protein